MNPVQLFARHPGPFFAVLDGPCASGKTTLAAFLEHAIPNLYIVHMDDYYIPMAQKTPERLSVPGGNADTEPGFFHPGYCLPMVHSFWKAVTAVFLCFLHQQTIVSISLWMKIRRKRACWSAMVHLL